MSNVYRHLWNPVLETEPMSVEDFTKKFLPQYSEPYSSPMGIRMVRTKSGRMKVQESTKASHQAQVTKRNNIINEAYGKYCELLKSELQSRQK